MEMIGGLVSSPALLGVGWPSTTGPVPTIVSGHPLIFPSLPFLFSFFFFLPCFFFLPLPSSLRQWNNQPGKVGRTLPNTILAPVGATARGSSSASRRARRQARTNTQEPNRLSCEGRLPSSPHSTFLATPCTGVAVREGAQGGWASARPRHDLVVARLGRIRAPLPFSSLTLSLSLIDVGGAYLIGGEVETVAEVER